MTNAAFQQIKEISVSAQQLSALPVFVRPRSLGQQDQHGVQDALGRQHLSEPEQGDPNSRQPTLLGVQWACSPSAGAGGQQGLVLHGCSQDGRAAAGGPQLAAHGAAMDQLHKAGSVPLLLCACSQTQPRMVHRKSSSIAVKTTAKIVVFPAKRKLLFQRARKWFDVYVVRCVGSFVS